MTTIFYLKKKLIFRGPYYYFETTDTWEEYCNIDKKNNKKNLFPYFLKKKKQLKIKRDMYNVETISNWKEYCNNYKIIKNTKI